MAYNCEQEIRMLKKVLVDKEKSIFEREAVIEAQRKTLEHYKQGLEIIAGRRRCVDSLMGNKRMAELVLDGHWEPDTSQAPTESEVSE